MRLLRTAQPGRRFEARYERHRSSGRFHRVLAALLGAVLLLVGIVMIPFPGPGWVVTALGVGLLGGESKAVSRFLDRVEWRAHDAVQRRWKPLPLRTRRLLAVSLSLVGGAALLLIGWASWVWRDTLTLG